MTTQPNQTTPPVAAMHVARYPWQDMSTPAQRDFSLSPEDNERLAAATGPFDQHLRQIELRLGVEIGNRGFVFRVIGDADAARAAERVIRQLYEQAADSPLD